MAQPTVGEQTHKTAVLKKKALSGNEKYNFGSWPHHVIRTSESQQFLCPQAKREVRRYWNARPPAEIIGTAHRVAFARNFCFFRPIIPLHKPKSCKWRQNSDKNKLANVKLWSVTTQSKHGHCLGSVCDACEPISGWIPKVPDRQTEGNPESKAVKLTETSPFKVAAKARKVVPSVVQQANLG